MAQNNYDDSDRPIINPLISPLGRLGPGVEMMRAYSADASRLRQYVREKLGVFGDVYSSDGSDCIVIFPLCTIWIFIMRWTCQAGALLSSGELVVRIDSEDEIDEILGIYQYTEKVDHTGNPELLDGIIDKAGTLFRGVMARDLLFYTEVPVREGVVRGNYGEERVYRGEELNFVQALAALKRGAKVSRASWNGCKVLSNEICEILPRTDAWISDAGGRRAMLPGWVASQTDMLAEDWQVLED